MYTSPALILNSMWAKKIKTISSVCLKPRTKTEALGKVSSHLFCTWCCVWCYDFIKNKHLIGSSHMK